MSTLVPPLVRVEDATLAPDGGPVRVAISRIAGAATLEDALHISGSRARVVGGRVVAVTTPKRLIDAAGRSLGRTAAEALEVALTAALAAWGLPPQDLDTPSGTLPCSDHVIVMGVLNVTPDSFSDGGTWFDPAAHPGAAIERGHALHDAGADVVDVGGESTRPGAEPVPEDEELRRVVPVVEALAGGGLTVSVDTTKAAVARAAVAAGAAIVNDVSAGALDGLMLPTVAELGVPYVAMHMRGTPRTMQRGPAYADVVAEVFDFLAEAIERCETQGIARDRTVVDPGIGFGKTVEHNLDLLRRTREFTSLGRPVLVGTSRKSFLGRIAGAADDTEDATAPELRRLEGSLVTAALAVAGGAAIVRAHDVAQTVRAVMVARAVSRGI